MTTPRLSAADTARDLTAASAATDAYFADRIERARRKAEEAAAELAAAEQRQQRVASGAERLTRLEALSVYDSAHNTALNMGRDLFEATAPGHAEWQAALEHSQSVLRGLVASGYQLPPTITPDGDEDEHLSEEDAR